MKRPQSAVTRIEDLTSSTSKLIRPLSGITDATQRINHTSVDQLISKANYSLQLMNIIDALALYEQAFKLASHHLTSIRAIKLLEDVVNQLIRTLKKMDDKFTCQQILNKLLAWCQIQYSDDIMFIKCPILIQVRALNAYGEYLRKIGKYDDCNKYLQMALQMIASHRMDQVIDDVIGETYLLLSTNSLYLKLYAQAIKEAQSALQHLQQAALTVTKEEIHQNITDTFINLGIAKEHEKLYQEAHYNYYSSLVYAQQNLNEQKQLQIQTIYDQFLSRQATYLQKLTFNKQKSLKLFSGSKKQQANSQPFVEIVKNMQNNNQLSSQFFKKKQKIIQSLERQKTLKEQKALAKFKPYINKLPNQSQVLYQTSKTPTKTTTIANRSGVRILKVSQPKQQSTTIPTFTNNFLPPSLPQFKILSPFIQYLEKLISEKQKSHSVQQLQQYPNIHLPSIENNKQQIILQGAMTIYLFQQQSILYLQYMASEISDQFQTATSQQQYKYLIGMSLNISDVFNQFNASNQDMISQKAFLLNFSIEYFKFAKINISKQSFSLPYSNSNQFYIYVPQQSQNVLLQMKNEYESLIFLVEGDTNVDIQPVLQQNRSVLSDEIQPLLEQKSPTQDYKNDKNDDIQPILGITEEPEEKQASDYSEDFEEPEPLIQQQTPPRYNGMEKFTIKIESEDQKQEVIEVYAGDKKEQQGNDQQQETGEDQVEFDEELNKAALLIQSKFRNRKKQL